MTFTLTNSIISDSSIDLTWSGETSTSATFAQVNCGTNHTVGVRPDGTVMAWGYNADGQTNVPAGISNAVQAVASEQCSLVRRSDNSIIGWGVDTNGIVSNVPSNVVEIGITTPPYPTGIALKTDGTVVIWGYNTNSKFTVPAGLTNVISVAAGGYHMLALKTDGSVVAWGSSTSGQLNVPAGLVATQISAGEIHSLALKTDGSVVAWGSNSFGESTVPAGLTNVIAISAGDKYSLALKSDGTVVGWGDNTNGAISIPVGLTNVVAIDSGLAHAYAVKNTGEVVGWGYNGQGQTDNPLIEIGSLKILQNASIIQTLAGTADNYTITNLNGNTQYDFQVNSYDSSDVIITTSNVSTGLTLPEAPTNLVESNVTTTSFDLSWTAPVNNTGLTYQVYKNGTTYGSPITGTSISVTSLTANSTSTMTVTAINSSGESAQSTQLNAVTLPVAPTNLVESNVTTTSFDLSWTASAGTGLTYQVYKDGIPYGSAQAGTSISVTSLTANTSYTMTVTAINSSGESTQSASLNAVTAPEAPTNLVESNVTATSFDLSWTASSGATSYQVYKDGVAYDSVQAGTSISVTGLTANTSYTMTVTAINGSGESAQSASLNAVTAPEAPTNLVESNVTATSFDLSWTAPTNNTGLTYQVYKDGTAYGVPTSNTSLSITGLTSNSNNTMVVTAINSSGGESAQSTTLNVVTLLDTPTNFTVSNETATSLTLLWTSVSNATSYEIYKNDVLEATSLTNSVDLTGLNPEKNEYFTVRALSAISHSLLSSIFIKSMKTIVLTDTLATTSVNLTWTNPQNEFVNIGAGDYHSLAISSDNKAIAWGNNSLGETTVPAEAIDLVAIDGGYAHSIALKSDRTVIGWGRNDSGETTIPAGLNGVVAICASGYSSHFLKEDSTVVSIGTVGFPASLTDVIAISSGSQHVLALKSDKTVEGWGSNDYGQLDIPTGLSNVIAISSGELHSLALKSDGTVVAWGYNGYGQCDIPAGLTNVIAIAAGTSHSLALKNDGTLVAWGQYYNGTSLYTAVAPSLTGVVSIRAGGYHALALKNDNTISAWGYNTSGQATVPNPDSVLNVDSFNIYQNEVLIQNVANTVFNFNIVGLDYNTNYDFNVESIDNSNVGGGSNHVTELTYPEAPSALVASNFSTTSFDLSWTAPVNNTGLTYQVYKDGVAYGSVQAGTSINVNGLTPNSTSTMTVTAINSSGESTQSASLNVVTAPEAPTNLVESNVTTTSFDLSWTAPVNNTGLTYQVYKDGVTYGSAQAGVSINVTGLAPNSTSTMTVTAINGSRESAQSASLNVLTLPDVIVSLTSSTQTANSLTIEWNTPTGGADSYKVYVDDVEQVGLTINNI